MKRPITLTVNGIQRAAAVAFLCRRVEALVGTRGEPEAIARATADVTAGVEVNGDTFAPAARRAIATALERAG